MAMADDLLRGRRRRYFGYMADIAHKIDTPESAKSFRSVLSPITRKVQWKYEPVKSFKPDPPGQSRFADKILHRAISTQVPGLLPALKNSPQFEEHDESLKINLRSPIFEQHKQRSLHYFWLPRNERTELCGILNSHLKPSEKRKNAKRFAPRGKRAQLTGLAAETAILDQQEYLENIANDPRFSSNKAKILHRRRVSEVSDRLVRMNRKFQTSYWDPTFNKNLTDPYRRIRGKLPACDAVCHEHFGDHSAYKDLLTCVGEYQKRYEEKQDLDGECIELGDKRDQLRRLSLFGTLEDEERRRGIKHIKELKEYDKESEALWTKQAKLMISAAEYINKIKVGRRFPTPPRELTRKYKLKKSRKDGDINENSSARSEASTINVEEYLQKKSGVGQHDHMNPHRQKWKKRRHFHHNYNTDDFYMEMYLHFLNPEEDFSLKAPPKQLMDVKELRKKMNLDEDHEKDKRLVDLLNESSIEAMHLHGPTRKSVWQLGGVAQAPHEHAHPMTQEEIEHEKLILEHHLEKLNNPRLTHILTRMMSQMSLTNSSLTMTTSSGASRKTPQDEDEATIEAADQMTSHGAASMDEKMTLLAQSVGKGEKSSSGARTGGAGASTGRVEADDEDLDKLGDIPEHELRLIMSEIAVSSKGSGSTDNLSSGSSGGEEEEGEGEGEDLGDDDALKLFKKARRKKDSLAEFMDLTQEFRARVCQGEAGKLPGQMNPFAEAVCILYPEGSEKKGGKSKKGTKTVVSAASVSPSVTKDTTKSQSSSI